MNCLHCGKPLLSEKAEHEPESGWHASCVRKFFSTTRFPEIDLSEEVMQALSDSNASKGYTVPGVQKKLSLHLTGGRNARLTLVDQLPGYILKPQTRDYPNLPEAEFLTMQMAKASGIKTVPFGLIKIRAGEEHLAYITKRIDRRFSKRKPDQPEVFAMEDFCQLDGRLTVDKYGGSYERCAKIISAYSDRPGLDLTELYLLLVFSYVTGNSDLHLKNLSLIETEPMKGIYVLSAAYDLLPVRVILPEDKDEMALTIAGKKRNLRKKDFLYFAEVIGIGTKTARYLIERISLMEQTYLKLCEGSYLSAVMKLRFAELIRERCQILRS